MKTFVALIVFGFIAVAVIVIIVINVLYRNMKRMREDVEDFMYRRGRRQEQKDRNPFGEDYFKSAKTAKTGKTTTRTTYRDKHGNVHVETYVDGEQVNKTTRRTTTSGGVTIIDERPEDKKIFEKGDDEYVEFEEVK